MSNGATRCLSDLPILHLLVVVACGSRSMPLLACRAVFILFVVNCTRLGTASGAGRPCLGPRHRAPLPQRLLLPLSCCCLDAAFQHPQQALYLISAALVFMLAFKALLRPGEMVRLRAQDLSVEWDDGILVTVVAITMPKNRRAMGLTQFRMVRDTPTSLLLQWIVKGLPGRVKIWPSDRQKLVWYFEAVLERLAVPKRTFTLGCFRPGRYNSACLEGCAHPPYQVDGGLDIGEQPQCLHSGAMSLLVYARLGDENASHLEEWSKQFGDVWSAPPSIPLFSIFSRRRQCQTLRYNISLLLPRLGHL